MRLLNRVILGAGALAAALLAIATLFMSDADDWWADRFADVPWDRIGFWVSAVAAGGMCLFLIGVTCLFVLFAASRHPLAGVIVGGLAALWTRWLFGMVDEADLALFKSPALDLDWPPRFTVATWALIGVSFIAGLVSWNRERRY